MSKREQAASTDSRSANGVVGHATADADTHTNTSTRLETLGNQEEEERYCDICGNRVWTNSNGDEIGHARAEKMLPDGDVFRDCPNRPSHLNPTCGRCPRCCNFLSEERPTECGSCGCEIGKTWYRDPEWAKIMRSMLESEGFDLETVTRADVLEQEGGSA